MEGISMEKDIVYAELSLKEPLRAFEFLVNIMGFKLVKETFELKDGILIQNKFGACFKLLLKPGIDKCEPVLIYTDDCLNDYFELKISGIRFNNDPKYIPDGLMAEFADGLGNNYKLLERRKYEVEE